MSTNERKQMRHGTIKYVRLGNTRTSPTAQRSFKPSQVKQMVAEFDIDIIGIPIVSHRAGHYWIIDGQHRIAAIKEFLGEGSEDTSVEMHVYEGLTEKEEADKFLHHNDQRAVGTFDKFRIAEYAGREEEVAIKRLVELEGLRISKEKINGAISAVGTLRKVYRRGDSDALSKTLRITRDAFGDAGLREAILIEGLGLVCHRYNGKLPEKITTTTLNAVNGGAAGLLSVAEAKRQATGNPKTQCIAASVVEYVNKALPRGKKLPEWFNHTA